MPKLIIVTPKQDPREFELEDSATIGRIPECSIQVDEAACSRRHCQVIRLASGYELVDLKSTNGTIVNGTKRSRHKLSDGDVFEIGSTRITYRDPAAAKEVVLEDVQGGGAAESDCYLLFPDGDRKGEKVPLASSRVTIGRKDSNSLVLKDTMASSYHCEITREGGVYVLRDLGSTNGSIVNGEPVSEATLGNGARIRLGHTRLVFVDPAIADFEKALAHEEEGAETDWGLMRAQVDLGRAKRASRFRVIAIGTFLVVVVGAILAVTVWQEPVTRMLGMKEVATIHEIPGNRIASGDFSLEAPRGRWSLVEGSGGTFRVGDGPAHQGSQSLQVTGSDKEGSASVVAYDRDYSIVSGRAYRISAWVRTGGSDVLARVGVSWSSSQDRAGRRISFTPFAESGGFRRVKAVVVAPPSADACRIVACVVGGGTAAFDDFGLVSVDSGEQKPFTVQKSGFELDVGAGGTICISKAGEFLLWNGGVVGMTAKGRLCGPPYRFVADRFSRSAKGAVVEGTLRLPGGMSAPVKMSVSTTDSGFTVKVGLKKKVEGLDALGIGFTVSRDYLARGATLTIGDSSRQIQSESDVGGVDKAILGGPDDRMSVDAVGGARFRMHSEWNGLGFAELAPAKVEDRTFGIVMDFSSQQQKARDLLSRSRSARMDGRLGQALHLAEEVLGGYPFDPDVSRTAEELSESLKKDGEKRLEEARKTFEGADPFFDEADLAKALTGARKVAADFAGYDAIAKPAGELAKQIAAAAAKISKDRDEILARRMMARAEDFGKHGQAHLARLFLKRIVALYPETDVAAKARAALAKPN